MSDVSSGSPSITRDIDQRVRSERFTQTSTNYLYRLSSAFLGDLLEASTKVRPPDIEVARLNALIKDVTIKSRSYKMINSTMFCFSIMLMVAGIFWPLIHHLLRINTDADVAGALQSIFTTTGGFCFGIHRQYKNKQTKIEDALRRTLFATEKLEVKFDRLLEAVPGIDNGAETVSV
jgi:hypothetical protein